MVTAYRGESHINLHFMKKNKDKNLKEIKEKLSKYTLKSSIKENNLINLF